MLLYWKSRRGFSGEVANQQMHMPLILPKVPGRFYYYFGKPLETQGMPMHILQLGMYIKCGVRYYFSFNEILFDRKRTRTAKQGEISGVLFASEV